MSCLDSNAAIVVSCSIKCSYPLNAITNYRGCQYISCEIPGVSVNDRRLHFVPGDIPLRLYHNHLSQVIQIKGRAYHDPTFQFASFSSVGYLLSKSSYSRHAKQTKSKKQHCSGFGDVLGRGAVNGYMGNGAARARPETR